MTGLPPRPCLIDGEMHSGERFFSPGEANICRNTLCISKIFNVAQWKKIRCLGVLSFFKPGLSICNRPFQPKIPLRHSAILPRKEQVKPGGSEMILKFADPGLPSFCLSNVFVSCFFFP